MKGPEGKPPFVNWAIETRNALGLSSEHVAEGTGYDDSSIRKFEGGSVVPSRPLKRAVQDFLTAEAQRQGKTIRPAPESKQVSSEDVDRVRMEALGALTVALEAQAEAMRELAAEMRELRESTLGQSAGLGAALGALAETLESLKPALIGRSR